MSKFTDYDVISRNQVIPNCPQCGLRDNVLLIDSTKDECQVGTIPVWHCGKCDKIFGERTNDVLTSITSQHYDSNDNQQFDAKKLANMIVNGSSYELVQAIQDLAKQVWIDHHISEVERKIKEASVKLKIDIDAALKAAVKVEQDPLTDVRRKVAAFVLR
jgi:hypothetical protein